MEGSESSEDKVPMFDKAAVIVAVWDRDTELNQHLSFNRKQTL